ncbi:MAG: phosphotransferase [Gemmatimonadetes bacterium]|jgi:5-methylthioribose kinase|nr:phosphotransferase [Gemmatimonadota bacterium]
MNLEKKALSSYLQRKKLLDKGTTITVRTIGDGMKNLVYLVSFSGQRLIVKQALSRVQIKERWWVDRKRIFAEKNCIEILEQILPPDVIPDTILEDRTDFILVTTAPPENGVLWEDELARGRIDLQIAVQCGELLATVHNETWDNRDLKSMFKDTKPFEQLRIDPYYQRLVQSFPDLKKVINTQSRHLLRDGHTLVLGDMRPRNVWISGGQLYLVDFATAHYGSPSFDLAFYATDMCVKAMNNSTQKAAYLEAINVFWNSYFRIAEYETVEETTRRAVCDLGCLLLAATDGRQPVEFLDPHVAELSRRIAQSLLFTELARIEEITEFINRTLIDG